ncbi:hypothetical protein [Thermosporothrix hazakensis]|uniref:hypothetical protein n=1 Tax=Thermosporothrix hazakensis TaxID=644383 RepID=UPI001B871329|nr:hypothetical protein [Thermosporothrix hazakensis]
MTKMHCTNEKPMEVKGPLGQVGTHLKSAPVERLADGADPSRLDSGCRFLTLFA